MTPAVEAWGFFTLVIWSVSLILHHSCMTNCDFDHFVQYFVCSFVFRTSAERNLTLVIWSLSLILHRRRFCCCVTNCVREERLVFQQHPLTNRDLTTNIADYNFHGTQPNESCDISSSFRSQKLKIVITLYAVDQGAPKFQKVFKISWYLDIFCTGMYESHFCKKNDFFCIFLAWPPF